MKLNDTEIILVRGPGENLASIIIDTSNYKVNLILVPVSLALGYQTEWRLTRQDKREGGKIAPPQLWPLCILIAKIDGYDVSPE